MIVDARPKGVYDQGHIETAANLTFSDCLNADKTFKSPEEIKKLAEQKGIKESTQPVIASCNKGFTACTLDTALKIGGFTNTSVYDGSWFEYSQRNK